MVAYTYYERDPRVRREAEALCQAGHTVHVVALRAARAPAAETVCGVAVTRLLLRRWRGPAAGYIAAYLSFLVLACVVVAAKHLRHRYHVIHVHNMPDFLAFAGLVPKLQGVPVVLDVHDPMPEVFSAMGPCRAAGPLQAALRIQEKVSHRFADRLITVHEGMRELLIAKGVPAAKIDVVLNLPDTALFQLRTVPERRAPEFRLVYAGTVSARHRIDTAIRALAILTGEMPQLRLHIVGDGPAIHLLQQLAIDSGVASRVFFHGPVTLEQVVTILASSDAAVSTQGGDLFGDLVFPTKVAEALTVGLPVLCARTPTTTRYFDEATLFYFEPNNPESLAREIRRIQTDQRLVAVKMQNAARALSTLCWDVEKRKLVRLIGALAA